MARPVIKINHGAVREILRGDGVKKELLKQGEKIARRAGPGFEAAYFKGRNRGRVTVEPRTSEAIAAQAKGALKKALK